MFVAILLIAEAVELHMVGEPADGTVVAVLLFTPLLVASAMFGIYGFAATGVISYAVLSGLADMSATNSTFNLRMVIIAGSALAVAFFIHLLDYYQRRLHHALMHDAGTGLPGRRALWRALDRMLEERQVGQAKNGLAVITIDNLQEIASTFGYEAADVLILELWERLVSIFHPGALVYHYHRERLAVLFYEPDNDLNQLMGRLEASFNVSIIHDGVPVHFVTHVGFVRLSGEQSRRVINRAEAAVDHAREHDRQSAIYSSGMERDRRANLMLLGAVYGATQNGHLTLHYQPKMGLASPLRVIGFEALARWHHPTLGEVAPSVFIPLIEKTELIHYFTQWAIDTALTQFKALPPAYRATSVAVNISSHNLAHPEFADQVRALLTAHELPPEVLELEITETEIMRNPQLAIDTLNRLTDIPLVISIDDFGTGYSSLAYLHRLPATIIKIDRVFVAQMVRDPGARAIVKSAIDLAHELEMKVTAEGIETEEQLEDLRLLGCDIGQGYLFAPALPANEAANWHHIPGSTSAHDDATTEPSR